MTPSLKKTMDDNAYLDELRTAITPLVQEVGLKETAATVSPLFLAARYANATTGVEFAVEWRELSPRVTLFELSGGAFVDLQDPVQLSGPRRVSFDADDLLNLRKPAPSPVGRRLRRKGPGEIEWVMSLYSQALLTAASDVLHGDFEVFDQLDAIVSARAGSLGSGS